MDPSRHSRLEKCQYCHTEVPRSFFEIHVRRCLAVVSKSTNQVQALMKNTDERPKKEPARRRVWEEEQTFQCYLCGKMQTISQLDDHIEVCPNRQIECQDCNLKFPRNLLAQHRAVCEGHESEDDPFNSESNINSSSPSSLGSIDDGIVDSSELEDSDLSDFIDDDEEGQFSDDEGSIQISEDSSIHHRRENLQRRLRQQFARTHVNHTKIVQIQTQIEDLRRQIQRRARSADVRRKGGMSKNQIEKLPSFKYEFDGRNKEACSVCYTDFSNGQVVKDLECKHLFHTDCISPWLLRNKTCPNCKQVVKANTKPRTKIESKSSKNNKPGPSKIQPKVETARSSTFPQRVMATVKALFKDSSSQNEHNN